MNAILILIFGLVLTTVTFTAAAGYKSTMASKSCTDAECKNITLNCLHTQPCVTKKWNSTDSEPQIITRPGSSQIIQNDAPSSILNNDEFR
jgi:hypothetical protein